MAKNGKNKMACQGGIAFDFGPCIIAIVKWYRRESGKNLCRIRNQAAGRLAIFPLVP
jgi:hypothetical protein